MEGAHDQAIWTMDWHPLGHLLATGSNDNNTKFWARNRPGDTQEDIFGLSPVTGVLTSQSHQSNVSTNKPSDKEAVGRGELVDASKVDSDEALIIPGKIFNYS